MNELMPYNRTQVGALCGADELFFVISTAAG
jgi:hypothetical protein